MSLSSRPIYQIVGNQPEYDPALSNSGLWYDKFCDTWKDEEDWKKCEINAEQKLSWINSIKKLPDTRKKDLIKECINRREKLVKAIGGKCILYKTESRFVTGLGREHPIENGFTWHHTLGVPYLPGSSVKGMVRAWAEQFVDTVSKEEIKIIFGPRENTKSIGTVIFFDALPIKPVKLEADVMTPHYSPYYQSGDVPGDWHNPTPIPFLVVAEGAEFQFAIAPRKPEDEEYKDKVEEWLKDALQWIGAGAKTAVGYGRFILSNDKTK